MTIFEEIQAARNQQACWDKNTADREFLVVIFQILSEAIARKTRNNLIMLAAVIIAWVEFTTE